MILGRVVGTLVANRKDEGLLGQKLLLVRNVTLGGEDASGFVVAVDSVGAGEGEMVLYASGSSARQTHATHEKPCDAVVMAIVDSWEVGGEEMFRKTSADGEWAS
ncbi:MAG: EutN/CcmL family microcompartment protein [bacterium]|nr:EutN/CcmL family microcompartment protein [bacterium]